MQFNSPTEAILVTLLKIVMINFYIIFIFFTHYHWSQLLHQNYFPMTKNENERKDRDCKVEVEIWPKISLSLLTFLSGSDHPLIVSLLWVPIFPTFTLGKLAFSFSFSSSGFSGPDWGSGVLSLITVWFHLSSDYSGGGSLCLSQVIMGIL